jgi:hypothetical protein
MTELKITLQQAAGNALAIAGQPGNAIRWKQLLFDFNTFPIFRDDD